MPKYLVRVSRASWHMGNAEITAANPERAVEHALEIADTVDLKDWGETVDLSHMIDMPLEEILHDGILQEAYVIDTLKEDGDAEEAGQEATNPKEEADPEEEAGQEGSR